MRTLRAWFLRLAGLLRKEQRDREFAGELESHLQLHIQDNLQRGLSPEEARRDALLKLGGIEQTKERYRDRRGLPFLETLLQDLRFAARMLRKSPDFTAVAVLTLALAIGANTAIFSVLHAVVLSPLPFASPAQLVWLNGKFALSDDAAVSAPDFVDYRASTGSFSSLCAMGYRATPSNLSGDKPEQVLSTFISANSFRMLGIQPMLGRDFEPSDEQVKEPQVAILGHGIWKRDFGADTGIIGQSIRLDGRSLVVVGVLPKDPPLLSEAEIWVPAPLLAYGMNLRLAHFLKVIGRLKPGVLPAQSQADLDAIAARLAQQYPGTNKGWSLRQRPLNEVLIGPVRPALLLISSAVALLLLIACANVANLLMARSVARQKEFAVRTALGASRRRLIRQTLTESIMLALCGGGLGMLAAVGGVGILRATGPSDLPRLNEVHIDGTVLVFSAVISLLTGVLFGVLPAVQASSRGFVAGIKESGRSSASASRHRLSSVLVAGEVAISLTLLIGAGLLLKSFWLLIHVNPGFQSEHVVTARLSLGGPAYQSESKRVVFWRQLEARVASLPGVEAVGATSELPLGGEHSDCPFYLEGRTYAPSEFDGANCRQVTPGYLAAMHIPLLAGRWLDEHDTAAAPGVALVNQAFATRFFSGQNAIGKRLQVMEGGSTPRLIVGVVANINHSGLSDPQQPEMYVPYAQFPPPTMNMVVLAAANVEGLAAALRDTVSAVDRDETISALRSMDNVIDRSVAQPRFSSQLLGLFAVLALLLAAIGLYGLMAYSVTQRTNEIGIRMALGASPRAILRMALSQGLRLAALGTLIGFGGALALSRLLRSFLFGVSATDPLTFLSVGGMLLAVALLAAYLPARRAMRVDPIVALRYE